MRRNVGPIAAVLITAALSPLGARAAAIAKPARTLPQLVQLAGRIGRNTPVGQPLSSNLGFSRATGGPTLSYDDALSSDKRSHDFTVVQDKGAVSDLVWSNLIVSSHGVVDSMSFRSTADGKLLAAVLAHGPIGKVSQTKLSTKSSATRRLFELEKRFFLEEAPSLKQDK